jgi:hypothetical protein
MTYCLLGKGQWSGDAGSVGLRLTFRGRSALGKLAVYLNAPQAQWPVHASVSDFVSAAMVLMRGAGVESCLRMTGSKQGGNGSESLRKRTKESGEI